MGATAISQFREGFSQNLKDRRAWGEAIRAGRLPAERGIAITPDDALRARATETLMCGLEVDVAAVCEAMGMRDDSLDDALESARVLEAAGLCHVSGSVITVPEAARIMLRTVAQCFDARSPASAQQRHAKAV